MSSFRTQLWRALVTGGFWAIVGGVIAFVLFPIYLYGFRPWEDGLFWRNFFGPGSREAPSHEQVLQAAAGFALLGAVVGFIGGFLAGLQADTTEEGK